MNGGPYHVVPLEGVLVSSLEISLFFIFVLPLKIFSLAWWNLSVEGTQLLNIEFQDNDISLAFNG